MNMMPQPMGMAPMMPPMPTPEQIEEAKLIIDACTWEEISGVLRSDDRRNYTFDVETDATAFEDQEVEKQQRIEFIGAMTTWLPQAIAAVKQDPALAPLMKEMTMFSVGAFPVARSMEEAFEDAFEEAKKAQPQPDPEAEKMKAEMAMEQKRFEMDMQLKQIDLQGKQQTAQINAQTKQADVAAKQQSTQMDMEAKQLDLQLKQVSAQLDIMLKKMQMGIEREKLGLEQEKMALDSQAAHEQHQIKRDDMVFTADMKRQEAVDRREERQQAAQERSANGAAA